MADSSLISTFLTSGIQQISFFIPFLQSEDCEVHISNALTRGYLFSAVAPLSIFGSLGILKQGFTLWLLTAASTEKSRSFVRALLPVGFEPKGDASTLLTIEAGKKQFVGETRLSRIIKQLDDNEIETLEARTYHGNWWFFAALCSLLVVSISVTPYIPSVVSLLPAERPVIIVALSFPLIRALGSLLITVTSQLVLQHEILNLVENRILFTKLDKTSGKAIQKLSDVKWSGEDPSGECLHTLARTLARDVDRRGAGNTEPRGGNENSDLESGAEGEGTQVMVPEPGPSSSNIAIEPRSRPRSPGTTLDGVYRPLKKYIDRQRVAILRKLIQHSVLLVGMVCSTYGYFGCFVLVQQTEPTEIAPVLWLILEIVLAIIRLLIWAWDPSFDENTALVLSYHRNNPIPGVPSTAGSNVDLKFTWGLTLSTKGSAGGLRDPKDAAFDEDSSEA